VKQNHKIFFLCAHCFFFSTNQAAVCWMWVWEEGNFILPREIAQMIGLKENRN
jgi:hypothetical protein